MPEGAATWTTRSTSGDCLHATGARSQRNSNARPIRCFAPDRGKRAVKEVKFTSEVAASRATQASHGRYRLSPREAYVLRSAPIRGLGQAERAAGAGEAVKGGSRMMWMVRDEDLSNVVEGLLLRGFSPAAALRFRHMLI